MKRSRPAAPPSSTPLSSSSKLRLDHTTIQQRTLDELMRPKPSAAPGPADCHAAVASMRCAHCEKPAPLLTCYKCDRCFCELCSVADYRSASMVRAVCLDCYQSGA